MFGQRRQQGIREYGKSPIALVLGFILLLVVGKAAFNVFKEERRSREALALAESSLADVKVRNAFLDSEIERLDSERGIEEEIREKFRVAKDGEEMFIIVEPEAEESPSVIQGDENLWRRIRMFFGF